MPTPKRQSLRLVGPPSRLSLSNATDNNNADFEDTDIWNVLPNNVLREIFKNSSFADRMSMGQVCKSWHQGFRDPVLWRKKYIEFFGGRKKDDKTYAGLLEYETDTPVVTGKGAIKFLKVFPTSLQDVKINFWKKSLKGAKEIDRDFKTLATSLDNTTLRNLRISNLNLDREKGQILTNFVDSVERLLQNQRSLRKCHITSACLDLDNGIKVLKCLAESSGTVIENLSLKEYFRMGMQIYREGRVVTELQKFRSIVRIFLDYDTVSTELVQLWSRGCPTLSYITLLAKSAVPRGNLVTCDAWQALVDSRPNVLVDLRASEIQNTRETLPILSPAIPVYNLRWGVWMDVVASEFELICLLHRLAGYHRTIKFLNLYIFGEFPNLDTVSVQKMLSNCKYLLPVTCECEPADQQVYELGTWRLSTATDGSNLFFDMD